MKNLTPLQLKAQQLREEYKRAEAEKQKQQQDKLFAEKRELITKFSTSFSTLYSLLIGSDVQIGAEAGTGHPVILLSCNGNKVFIGLKQISDSTIGWTLFNNCFRPTLPSTKLGVAINREDEDKLILAVEELLFAPQPTLKMPDTAKLTFPLSST